MLKICISLCQMYVTSVLWSDKNDIVVYRTFRDFKKIHVSGTNTGYICGTFMSLLVNNNWLVASVLQKQMKKAFPPASKFKKSDRIIPRFRGVCAKLLLTMRSAKLTGFWRRVFTSSRQKVATPRQEEGSQQVTVAHQVLAEILQWNSELRSEGLSVRRPHSVLPPQRPRLAAGVCKEQVGQSVVRIPSCCAGISTALYGPDLSDFALWVHQIHNKPTCLWRLSCLSKVLENKNCKNKTQN